MTTFLCLQKHLHEMGAEIYQMFISHQSSKVRTYLDRATIKGMEAFMIGDTVSTVLLVTLNIKRHSKRRLAGIKGHRGIHEGQLVLQDMEL